MPSLADLLAVIDNAKRRAGRNLSDLAKDPSGTLQMLASRGAEDLGGTKYEQQQWWAKQNGLPHDAAGARGYETKRDGAATSIALQLGITPTGRLISSQRYIDDDVVQKKVQAKDFTVHVSPPFKVGNETLQVIQDGHHAFAAAKEAGQKPNFVQQTARDNDRIELLKKGAIDDFLEASYVDSPWYYYDTNRDVW